jgi:hypothetical protein
MGAGSTNLFKDSSTCCFHESLTMLQREEGGGREESDSSAAFLRRERFDSFPRSWRADVNQGSVPNGR